MRKLFQNKKGQYAKAMRNWIAHKDKEYRKIKARYLYNNKLDLNQIADQLKVGPNTIKNYLRDTKNLTKDEAQKIYAKEESRKKFEILIWEYFFYLLVVLVVFPIIGIIIDLSILQTKKFWYMFFWKHLILSLIIIPFILYLFKKYNQFSLFLKDYHTLHTHINGLRHHCSPSYLEKIKKDNELILKLDTKNPYDNNAIKVINKKDGKHIGFIPTNFNKIHEINKEIENIKIRKCYVENIYKNPKSWLNSHTINIAIEILTYRDF